MFDPADPNVSQDGDTHEMDTRPDDMPVPVALLIAAIVAALAVILMGIVFA